MSVQFYPAANFKKELYASLELDVSVFNAEGIFEMLGITGKTVQGTIGELNETQILKAIDNMNDFILCYKWNWSHDSMLKYVSKLNLIFGYCLAKGCNFRWS